MVTETDFSPGAPFIYNFVDEEKIIRHTTESCVKAISCIGAPFNMMHPTIMVVQPPSSTEFTETVNAATYITKPCEAPSLNYTAESVPSGMSGTIPFFTYQMSPSLQSTTIDGSSISTDQPTTVSSSNVIMSPMPPMEHPNIMTVVDSQQTPNIIRLQSPSVPQNIISIPHMSNAGQNFITLNTQLPSSSNCLSVPNSETSSVIFLPPGLSLNDSLTSLPVELRPPDVINFAPSPVQPCNMTNLCTSPNQQQQIFLLPPSPAVMHSMPTGMQNSNISMYSSPGCTMIPSILQSSENSALVQSSPYLSMPSPSLNSSNVYILSAPSFDSSYIINIPSTESNSQIIDNTEKPLEAALEMAVESDPSDNVDIDEVTNSTSLQLECESEDYQHHQSIETYHLLSTDNSI